MRPRACDHRGMEERLERQARNEALVGQVNEHINKLDREARRKRRRPRGRDVPLPLRVRPRGRLLGSDLDDARGSTKSSGSRTTASRSCPGIRPTRSRWWSTPTSASSSSTRSTRRSRSSPAGRPADGWQRRRRHAALGSALEQLLDARPAVTLVSDRGVRPGAAFQAVGSRAAEEHVVAGTAEQPVVAADARDRVVAAETADPSARSVPVRMSAWIVPRIVHVSRFRSGCQSGPSGTCSRGCRSPFSRRRRRRPSRRACGCPSARGR